MGSRLILSGLRAIEECLRFNPDRISKILLPVGKTSVRVDQIRELATKRGVRIEPNPKYDADEPVLALMHDYEYTDFDSLAVELENGIKEGARPVVLALDGVNDPQNLGAILRTAAFMGVEAILIPKDRAAVVTDTVYRIASGGMEHVRVCQVTNLVSALKQLKEIGLWIVGFSEHTDKTLNDIPHDLNPVIVIGNEEKGIRALVKENCDFLVQFHSRGQLKSLNASVAAALAMSWAVNLPNRT
jgi:23S rRNA (guanosine2251-2'-O)-methyltransferase